MPSAKSSTDSYLVVSQSTYDDFSKFMETYAKLIQDQAAVHANEPTDAVANIATATTLVSTATYFPCGAGRAIAGRKDVEGPQAIIVARGAPASAKAEDASVFNLMKRFSTEAQPNELTGTPHFIVDYLGNVVQLIDLSDTAQFMFESASAVRRESVNLVDSVVDAVMAFTIAHEAGKGGAAAYTVFQPNDRGSAAYGCVQFNQAAGTLDQLLKTMYAADSAKFEEIFGEATAMLLDSARVKRTNITYLQQQFVLAGWHPAFQAAQRKVAKDVYWTGGAVTAARTLGLTSQRAYSIFFDGCIQRGPPYVARAANHVKAMNKASAREKLLAMVELLDNYTLKDGQFVPGERWGRRTALFADPRLSDAPLFQSPPAGVGPNTYSDANTAVIMFEGRVGDVITAAQRDAAAKLIKTIATALPNKITLGIETVLGADMLRLKAYPDNSNPGEGFSYPDLIGAATEKTADQVVDAKNKNLSDIRAAVSAMARNVFHARQVSGVQAMAALQAYDETKAFLRSTNIMASTREDVSKAAAAQLAATANMQSASGTAAAIAQVGPPPDPILAEDVVGLLYDFKRGLWSDDRPVGKIG